MKVSNMIVKVSIVVAIIVAMGILLFTFVVFYMNQETFTSSFNDTLANICDSIQSDTSADSDVLLTLRMQFMEKLSEMHKQASNSDLFVFIYGFLSSVLVGVSAYMVKKRARAIRYTFNSMQRTR